MTIEKSISKLMWLEFRKFNPIMHTTAPKQQSHSHRYSEHKLFVCVIICIDNNIICRTESIISWVIEWLTVSLTFVSNFTQVVREIIFSDKNNFEYLDKPSLTFETVWSNYQQINWGRSEFNYFQYFAHIICRTYRSGLFNCISGFMSNSWNIAFFTKINGI